MDANNRSAGVTVIVGWQVMNEVSIHRGRYPHLSVVDAYVDGEHLTEAVVSPPLSQLPRVPF
jgi:NADH kinase